MDRNKSFSLQSTLLNNLWALIRVIQCSDNQSCNCQHPANCTELKTLLHHIKTCDKSQDCGFKQCIQTILLMRHYLNCDQSTCACFQFGEKRNDNRFYSVIKEILLKNQFLIWRRKMIPFRQHFITKITDYLVGFYDENKDTISGQLFQFLIKYENQQFIRSTGISTYLTTIAQKCSEIQSNIILKNHQKRNANFINVDQEGNMKKIYHMLCLYSTDILHDKMASKVLMEERRVDDTTEKLESAEDSMVNVYAKQNGFLQNDIIKRESQETNYIKEEKKPFKLNNNEFLSKNVPSANSSSTSSALTPPKSNPSTKSSPEASFKPISEFVKLWTRKEIEDMFMSLHQRLWNDKDGEPFLYPVDWKTIGIEDYPQIVTNPMDMSTIRKKLISGDYKNPWHVIDDFWLMINNAWLYNKKSSKVYKSCTNIAKLFESLADDVMQSAGMCCGREYVYLPQVLICCTPKMCTVCRDAVYYCINNEEDVNGCKLVPGLGCDKYVCCDKCFLESSGDSVELMVSESTTTLIQVEKSLFTKMKNNIKEKEEFVECRRCKRQWHRVCAAHVDEIWRSGFYCRSCESHRIHRKQENRFTATQLPECRLSRFIEAQVDAWRLKQRDPVSKIVVRVLSVSEKNAEVKPEMRRSFVDSGEITDTLPYRLKAIFAFQDQEDGSEVCLFGMQCQEYGSQCPDPNSRRLYLAYLDSVHFFRPRHLRTPFYHRMLIAYLDYCRQLGFVFAHIWACPPGEGDDYIFHMHPPTQKLPKPKRLQEWYIAMLDQAVREGVVVDYCDIFSYTFSSRLLSISELPYFEGDYWPTVLEDLLKEDQHGIEHFMALMDDEPVAPVVAQEVSVAEQHPHSKKRKLKKMPNMSKRKRSSDALDGSSDLTKRLFEMIEKRKENFLVVRLHNQCEASKLGPVEDPDRVGFSELMDGRDRFLSLCRDKHLEWSSIRRAVFATMVMCYELHLECRNGLIYSCNECDQVLDGVRYTCDVCEEFELCEACVKAGVGHEHPLLRVGGDQGSRTEPGTSEASNAVAQATIDQDQARMDKTKHLIALFDHACQCRDANCRRNNCNKLKQMVEHCQMCPAAGPNNGCKVCDNVAKMQLAHVKMCTNHSCPLPVCINKRRNNATRTVAGSHHQSRLMQLAMERRRMSTAAVPSTVSTPGSTSAPTTIISTTTTEPYKAEMAAICAYVNELKSQPNMTQDRLKAIFQAFLDSEPRYMEAYVNHIQRQRPLRQQQQVAVQMPVPMVSYQYGQQVQAGYGQLGAQQQQLTTYNSGVQGQCAQYQYGSQKPQQQVFIVQSQVPGAAVHSGQQPTQHIYYQAQHPQQQQQQYTTAIMTSMAHQSHNPYQHNQNTQSTNTQATYKPS